MKIRPGLDAQRLDRGEAVRPDAERRALVEQRLPEPLGVLRAAVDLVAELAGVARARHPAAVARRRSCIGSGKNRK